MTQKRHVHLSLVVLLVALSGCASEQTRAIRLDGQTIKGNPALERQLEVDNTICQGEVAKADSVSTAPAARRFQAGADIFAGCMAQRGYVAAPR
jgi:hypothetical protein